MVVESLRHQLQRQRILLATRFLDFRPLVLEPDLYLGFVQSQFAAQLLSSPFRQIPILVELVLRKQETEHG